MRVWRPGETASAQHGRLRLEPEERRRIDWTLGAGVRLSVVIPLYNETDRLDLLADGLREFDAAWAGA